MYYILNESEIRQLYYHKLKPASVLKFGHQAVFTYTGEDIKEQAGRTCEDDVFEQIAEATCLAANLGECLADEISSRIVEDKLVDPDR